MSILSLVIGIALILVGILNTFSSRFEELIHRHVGESKADEAAP